jgi:hypothetical protein
MVLFYGLAQPNNIKQQYSAYDQCDFLIRQVPGREIQAGSLRITGDLNVVKYLVADPTTPVPITPADSVFVNPFGGAHVFISNATISINDRTIESMAYYGRGVVMDTQAKYTLEELTACSESAVELKGNNGNLLLSGSSTSTTQGAPANSVPFSFVPNLSINKTSTNLPSSKFPLCKVLLTLASPTDALYISTPEPNPIVIASLGYTWSNVQLHWIEVPEDKSIKQTTFNTNYLIVQTIVSSNTNLNIVAPTAYDAFSASFLQQAHRNNLYCDSNSCEFLPDITRVEFSLNNGTQPIQYAIGGGNSAPYQDLCLNYMKSLKGNLSKNSIMNRLLYENGCFGIGMSFASSVMDKLGVAITMNPNSTFQVSDHPFDACIYVSGFITL